MTPLPTVAAHHTHAVADALQARGACLLSGLPGVADALDLQRELGRLHASGRTHAATVGRQGQRRSGGTSRGDWTVWLDDPACGAAAHAHLAALDTLRTGLNRCLFLGMEQVEAHYALYPAGATYGRHRDAFTHGNRRVLSLVGYLNQDWQDHHGGALRLFLDGGPVEVMPRAGTGVCFLSGTEHEVLAATRERCSIAAWMLTRER